MPRAATLAPHRSVADPETRSRTTPDVVERTRWYLLWLIGQGHRVAAAADLVGYTHNWALAVLASPPPDGGLWTGPKVATWMSQRLGRPIHAQRGWEAMRTVGFTPQRPRPTAIQADPTAQEAFKKGGS